MEKTGLLYDLSAHNASQEIEVIDDLLEQLPMNAKTRSRLVASLHGTSNHLWNPKFRSAYLTLYPYNHGETATYESTVDFHERFTFVAEDGILQVIKKGADIPTYFLHTRRPQI